MQQHTSDGKIEEWGYDDEEWGDEYEDDNTGGSPLIPSPRRPDPRPGRSDTAELPPIDHERVPAEIHINLDKL